MKNILLITFLILSIPSAFAVNLCSSQLGADSSFLPKEIQEKRPELARTQPVVVRILGYQIIVHNKHLISLIKNLGNNQNKKSIIPLVELLFKKGTFEIPINDDGYVAAANNGEHHGGYGVNAWLRDMARVLRGLSALPNLLKQSNILDSNSIKGAKKLASGMLKNLVETEQIIRVWQNIIDPQFHLDPANGYRNVPFVRFNTETRKNGRKPTEKEIAEEAGWGHKQNDALSLEMHALMDSIEKGEVTDSQVSTEVLSQMVFLPAYFERVQYFKMEDVGAWEEGMGLRTSSVALVTSYLERFYDGWSGNQKKDSLLFAKLKKSWAKNEIQTFLGSLIQNNRQVLKSDFETAQKTLGQSLNNIPLAIKNSYELIYRRLGISVDEFGTRTYSDIKELETGRGADAALLHMLLYPPKGLTLSDRLHVVNQIKKNLMRESGFARYRGDWFFYGNPSATTSANKLPVDPDMIAVKDGDGYRNSTRVDRDEVYSEFMAQKYNKDMSKVIAKNGPDQEAQWAFQDSMLVQIYVQFYKETRDKTYLNAAGFHLSRALGAITGENQKSIEGDDITSFRALEAWAVVQLKINNIDFKALFASPNSPLNWTTAELIIALNDFMSVLPH